MMNAYCQSQILQIIRMHQQQVKTTEQIQSPKSKLQSSAFPSFQQVEQHSIFHQIITHCNQISGSFALRPFRQSDLYQLRNLQLQWFPLKYGDYFYNRLLNRHYECVVAECSVQIKGEILEEIIKKQQQKFEASHPDDQKKNRFWPIRLQYFQAQQFFVGNWKQRDQIEIKILVGAIVFEFTDSRGYLGSAWWTENVFVNHNTIYISTLGVIEEFRKKKVAQKLLDVVLSTADKNAAMKLILLHVIDYNQAAIRLYKKFGFEILEEIEKFYHIEQKPFKGIAMGRFYNGGFKKKNWTQWLRSFWE